ncbi:MAG: transcription termination/antitermination protein NusA [Lachnospiraceae bacterium]|nr:transcription termination/antitermination protein NusA [Lachnospiraceae bacterium]
MSEIIEALNFLEKEKGIDREEMIKTIETSIVKAWLNDHKDSNKAGNISANMDRETGAITLVQQMTIVDEVDNPATQISIEEARMLNSSLEVGDIVNKNVEIDTKQFGRIAAGNARNIIVQEIKNAEKNALVKMFNDKKNDIITGVVQRIDDRGNIHISLNEKTEVTLTEKEQVKSERFRIHDRIKLYVVSVNSNANKGKDAKILVSRTHPELVRKLFEQEVTEVADGVVEIKEIAREAGSRTKIAVFSNDSNVDPVGACVGVNGVRVNTIVDDLKGEKIDIITWDEDPAIFIKNALSPSDVVSVVVDLDEKCARVVVPDNQLSLAIGKEGQNARLAARLTNYKIDIKSESQAEALKAQEEEEVSLSEDSFDETNEDAGVIEEVNETEALDETASDTSEE